MPLPVVTLHHRTLPSAIVRYDQRLKVGDTRTDDEHAGVFEHHDIFRPYSGGTALGGKIIGWVDKPRLYGQKQVLIERGRIFLEPGNLADDITDELSA